jgi:hypothetical protein
LKFWFKTGQTNPGRSQIQEKNRSNPWLPANNLTKHFRASRSCFSVAFTGRGKKRYDYFQLAGMPLQDIRGEVVMVSAKKGEHSPNGVKSF